MNEYLITLVLLTCIIERKIAADNPRRAICALIQQVGKPNERISSLTCRAVK
jgi:hypothetical protein